MRKHCVPGIRRQRRRSLAESDTGWKREQTPLTPSPRPTTTVWNRDTRAPSANPDPSHVHFLSDSSPGGTGLCNSSFLLLTDTCYTAHLPLAIYAIHQGIHKNGTFCTQILENNSGFILIRVDYPVWNQLNDYQSGRTWHENAIKILRFFSLLSVNFSCIKIIRIPSHHHITSNWKLV